MIKLGFYGAAGEVTGSCYVLTIDRACVMIDMGMHQGERKADEHNRRMPAVDLARLDAVVLTHAHLDHCGRLPLLIKNGYEGPVHCTTPTAEITDIILRDSASIQMEDCERFNRRLRRGDEPCDAPLYDLDDVGRLRPRMRTIGYDEPKEIAEGITVRFINSGHILGAASAQMTVKDGNRILTVVFSGDIGMSGVPILHDPTTPTPADVVVMESTYGDHDHKSLAATRDELLAVLREAQAAGGRVLIPAFAVGRTQDLIYYLGEFIRNGQLQSEKVFIDSPMATSVSSLYALHEEIFDEDARQLVANHLAPLDFPGLTYTRTVEESKQLNSMTGALVIIAASGMCTGGRIMHHLVNGLPDPRTHVVIAGYQGNGTLGRQLVEGARRVSIFRQPVDVRAKIHTMGGFSAHAGQTGLLNWAEPYQKIRPRMFLTHGENGPRKILNEKLKSRLGLEAGMPIYGEVVEL